jgi:NodT family efflux transporter outer membrane factor (OMF) lipoprotein
MKILIIFLPIVLGGCVSGPGLKAPVLPGAYVETALPAQTASSEVAGGAAQKFVAGEDIPAQWWTLFKSEGLDRVIRAALAENPTLMAAEATLREAQENYNARAGSEHYPDVSASLSSARLKSSPAAAGLPSGTKGSIFDLHHASVNVAYTFDIFGGGRRELDALRAQVEYQRFQLEAAYLSLTANVVTTVIREASLREQLSALNEIVVAQEKHLSMLDKQMALGGVARTEVLAQRAQLEQTRAALPPVEKELSQVRHQLMLLAGKFPGDALEGDSFSLASITLPLDLPLTLPSSLVDQRPDVKAAEALLKAASARVGVATANLYPQITLSGSYGSEAGRPKDLFDANSMIWNVGAGVVQPIFSGGKLRAQRRASMAAFDAASAQFRQVVLVSYANVADVLRALEADARALKAQADAEVAARDSLEMTQKQLAVGAVNYVLLLNAERQYQQARISLIQARAARLSDTAALFQALGGGWWNRPAEKSKE